MLWYLCAAALVPWPCMLWLDEVKVLVSCRHYLVILGYSRTPMVIICTCAQELPSIHGCVGTTLGLVCLVQPISPAHAQLWPGLAPSPEGLSWKAGGRGWCQDCCLKGPSAPRWLQCASTKASTLASGACLLGVWMLKSSRTLLCRVNGS